MPKTEVSNNAHARYALRTSQQNAPGASDHFDLYDGERLIGTVRLSAASEEFIYHFADRLDAEEFEKTADGLFTELDARQRQQLMLKMMFGSMKLAEIVNSNTKF
jgi:hypothetical protein